MSKGTVTSNKRAIVFIKRSHGPTYFLRYPEKFKIFTPTCDTSDFAKCSQEQIINAYDNTIVYTSYFLSKTIKLLKKYTQYDTAMIYVSDHGESLGEHSLYLHGMPYWIAPDVQKKIPFMLWLSKSFEYNLGLKSACLEKKSSQEYSHDNIFHSILGLFNIQTTMYNKDLDIFSDCRN